MTVQEIYAQDYTSAKTYSWADMDSSGDWQKVKVIQGKSAAVDEAEKPHGVQQRYNSLSKTAKIAIAASVIGVVVLAALGILFYCIKQRRQGRREHAALLAAQDREAAENMEYKQQQMPKAFGGYGRL